MSYLDIYLFGVLFVLAVYDAREHRIPNIWLLCLLLVALGEKFILSTSYDYVVAIKDIGAGGLLFLSGLLLYLARAMAPGDVKLLGVYGFVVGWGSVLKASYYLGFAMILVGGLYWAFSFSRVCHQPLFSSAKIYFTSTPIRPLSLYLFLTQYQGSVKRRTKQEQMADRMPFAPVVVIGYALYRYYGG